METSEYFIRDDGVVWRDIAGQVVIAERDNSKIRTLNKVASVIWIMTDGTNRLDDVVQVICEKFDVTKEQAQVDSEEFYRELMAEKLIRVKSSS